MLCKWYIVPNVGGSKLLAKGSYPGCSCNALVMLASHETCVCLYRSLKRRLPSFPRSLPCLTAQNACNAGSHASSHAWAWGFLVRIQAYSSHTRSRGFEDFSRTQYRGKTTWSLSRNHSSHTILVPRTDYWFRPVQSVKAHLCPS